MIAGQAPSSRLQCPGALMAREWYARGCDYRDMRRPPWAHAYILQWRFAWRGCRPPTATQRARLLRLVEGRHPLLVLWF